MNSLDVLLINAPSPKPGMFYLEKRQGFLPPLGLGYLATYLKEKAYTVKIIDLLLPNKTVDTVKTVLRHNKTHVVGFSCTTETYKTALRLARMVKEVNAQAVVVFGGPHVSFEYESALDTNLIDYVVINEGERSLVKLCDYCIRGVGNLEDLKGIAYKKEGIVYCAEPEPFITDLDELPFPNRLLFDDLFDYTNSSTILTSRGCPGSCIFCAASVLSGGKYRMRSAENIVSELEYLKSLGFSRVDVLDDTMTASVTRLDEILDKLLQRDLKLSLYCESRVDSVSRDILKKMKMAGFDFIQFGVESGNQKILDSIKKDITLEQIRNVFEWCKELEINTITNMIIGQPSDDTDSIKDTIRIAEEIHSTGAEVSFTVCTPFPGTAIWENTKKFGIKVVDFDLDHYDTFTPVFNTRAFNTGEIRNLLYNAMKTLGKMQISRIPVNITDDSVKHSVGNIM